MKRVTLFVDVDGLLLRHSGNGASHQWYGETEEIEGARDLLDEAERRGYCIVLTTARKECVRANLIDELERHGMHYDQLLTGIGNGARIVLNDGKPDGSYSVGAISVKRNGPVPVTEIFRTIDEAPASGKHLFVASLRVEDDTEETRQPESPKQPPYAKPTEPGYYWYRGRLGGWKCAEVYDMPEGGSRMVMRLHNRVPTWVDESNGTWGPKIEAPKE